MLAHKCDICGTYYTKPTPVFILEDKKTSTKTYNQVYLGYANGHTMIDLCETCANELEEWLNGNRKAQNDQ